MYTTVPAVLLKMELFFQMDHYGYRNTCKQNQIILKRGLWNTL